jgi:hypothetical protein
MLADLTKPYVRLVLRATPFHRLDRGSNGRRRFRSRGSPDQCGRTNSASHRRPAGLSTASIRSGVSPAEANASISAAIGAAGTSTIGGSPVSPKASTLNLPYGRRSRARSSQPRFSDSDDSRQPGRRACQPRRRCDQPGRRGPAARCAASQASTSAACRGSPSDMTWAPADVTRTSSSMRMPIPRNSAGTSSSSGWK